MLYAGEDNTLLGPMMLYVLPFYKTDRREQKFGTYLHVNK